MKKNLFIAQNFCIHLSFCGQVSTVGLLLLLLISQFSFAQNPLVKQWDYRFGGLQGDYLLSIRQTKDDGYILGGYSYSGAGGDKTDTIWGSDDYWIVKTDSLGNKLWDKDYGGTGDDELYYLEQTTDGGYILGGYSFSGIGGDKTEAKWGENDYWIVKTDSLGNKLWDHDFGGSGYEYLSTVQQTTDGGYILGGLSESGISGNKTEANWGGFDFWIVKTDSLGNKEWEKDFGGTDGDELYSLEQTTDGGYILGGLSFSGIGGDKTQAQCGNGDYWIIKTDSLGIKQWERDFGGADMDGLYSLQQTLDGGYILAGSSSSIDNCDKTQTTWGDADYWIVKTDSLGNKQWDKDLGATGAEELWNISQTADGGYLLSGDSYSTTISGDKTETNLGFEQTWVVKTDSSGTKQWDKTLQTYSHSETASAIQIKDGCYMIGSFTDGGTGGDKTQDAWNNSRDYWIIKFCDTSGSYLQMPPVSALISGDNSLCEKLCTNFFDQSIYNPTSWNWQFPGGSPSSSTDQNPTNICYQSPGAYDVTLITVNAYGNDTLTYQNYITVYPTPPFPAITQVGYMLISSTASSYQWQLNAIDIPGATNQSYTVLQSGLYSVIIGDANGCKNSASQYVLISGIEGVDDATFFIYPNPSSGNFSVELSNGFIGDEVTIDVVNTLGQKVFSSQEKIDALIWKKEIDLNGAARDIYFIKIKTKDDIVKRKILIAQ